MGEIRSGRRRLTGEALAERAARAASGFAALGVKAGDTVALYLRNDLAFFEAANAAGLVGAYPVAVNWRYAPAEAAYLFENSGARAVVIHADLLPAVRDVIPSGLPVLVVPTPDEIAEAFGLAPEACQPPHGLPEWSAWRDGFAPAPPSGRPAPGAIIYTSGTTGHPKGVRRAPPSPEQAQASDNLLMTGFGFRPWKDRPGEIVTAVIGPMYHSAPNAYGTLAAKLGAEVILEARFDAENLLRLIEARRITHLHMVPIMFNRLLRLPDAVRARYDLSSLRFVVHAAAPCPPAVKREMIAWWGPIINEYYGSTETGMLTFCSAEEWLAHPGTVGRPLPGVTLRVTDAAGADVPTGDVGEVVGRVQAIADFTYHGDDDKRREADRDGLIAPGDIGYLDADGFLHLCDRSKDMIISGGVNIYPAEIEGELHRMDGVADCAVFGIPDEEYGEAVCAVVQPQPGHSLTQGGVQAYLRGRIAGYKVPRRVEFAAELPREDSGKIFKRKLREPFWAETGRRI